MNNRFDPKDTPGQHPNPIGSPDEPMSATEARQGRKGSPVLMVLISGLVLVMLAWVAAEWWGQAAEPPAQQTATPPAGDNTPQNSDAAPSANPANPPPPAAGASGGNP